MGSLSPQHSKVLAGMSLRFQSRFSLVLKNVCILMRRCLFFIAGLPQQIRPLLQLPQRDQKPVRPTGRTNKELEPTAWDPYRGTAVMTATESTRLFTLRPNSTGLFVPVGSGAQAHKSAVLSGTKRPKLLKVVYCLSPRAQMPQKSRTVWC